MGAAFVITLREAFEAALVLGIVYTYLHRTGAGLHARLVTAGAVAGFVASVLMGWLMTAASGPIADLGPDVIAIVVMFAAAGLLTWHGWWMQRQGRGIEGSLQRRIDEARDRRRLWVLALIAFTGVFREGAETVLFLWGLMSQQDASVLSNVMAAALGIVAAAALGCAMFAGGRRLSLRRFFAVTSIILLFVAAGLFSSGIGRLEGLGVLPRSPEVWDTSGVLDDHSLAGSFLAGLVGYRAHPSAFELAAYVAFAACAAWLFFAGRPTMTVVGRSERRERAGAER